MSQSNDISTPPSRRLRVGLGLSAVAGILLVAGVAYILFQLWKDEQRHMSEQSLKWIGVALTMYADESDAHYYPRLSSSTGRLIFRNESLRDGSKLIPDCFWPGHLVPPTNPHFDRHEQFSTPGEIETALADSSFYYLGYAVTSDDEVQAFAAAFVNSIAQRKELVDVEVNVAGANIPCGALFRLRKGVGAFYAKSNRAFEISAPNKVVDDFIIEVERSIPVLIEHPEFNDPPGGHVLFLDGHVEFIPYPGKWPMTETTISTLRKLASLR